MIIVVRLRLTVITDIQRTPKPFELRFLTAQNDPFGPYTYRTHEGDDHC
jgi:hypothetical protein